MSTRRTCSSPQARTLRVADGSVRSLLEALTEGGATASTKAVRGAALLKGPVMPLGMTWLG